MRNKRKRIGLRSEGIGDALLYQVKQHLCDMSCHASNLPGYVKTMEDKRLTPLRTDHIILDYLAHDWKFSIRGAGSSQT